MYEVLHWLPARQRISYIIASLVWCCLLLSTFVNEQHEDSSVQDERAHCHSSQIKDCTSTVQAPHRWGRKGDVAQGSGCPSWFETHYVRPRLSGPECLFVLNIRLTTSSESQSQLHLVARATTVASILYATPAWWGFVGVGDRQRLERLVARLRRMGYLLTDFPSVETLAEEADRNLFKTISQCPSHVLRHLLTDKPTSSRSLRVRAHNFVLPPKDNSNFLSRALYNAICPPMGDAWRSLNCRLSTFWLAVVTSHVCFCPSFIIVLFYKLNLYSIFYYRHL